MDTQRLAQQLVRDWQKPIYNFALRWFGDENHAADATQETFLVALRDLHQLRSPSKLRSWIFTVARRVMIRQGKRSSPGTLLTEVPSNDGQQSEQAMEKERQERISAELAALPEELRTVLILHYFHDLSQVEMAEQLSIPRTTIQSQLKRGLERLRTKLVACGISYGILELEQRFRSSPFAAVPDSLKAKLGSLATPTAVSVSALAAGGLIVKLKMMAVGALTLGLGLGSWFLLTGELQEGEQASLAPEQTPAYLALLEENKSLKKSLLNLRETLKEDSGPAPKGRQEVIEVSKQNDSVEKTDSEELKRLRAQVQRLKKKLLPPSPNSLIETYIRLAKQFEKLKKIEDDVERERAQGQIFSKVFDVLIKISSDPVPVVSLILKKLEEPHHPNQRQILELFGRFDDWKRLSVEDRHLLNEKIIEVSGNANLDVEVRREVLSALMLENDEKGSDDHYHHVVDIIENRESSLRLAAYSVLSKAPHDKTRPMLKSLLLDPQEDPELRRKILIYEEFYEDEDAYLRLLSDENSEIRSLAYSEARRLTSPSSKIRTALLQRLRLERNEDALESILRSLGELGDRSSIPEIQSFRDQGRFTKTLVRKIEDCLQDILKRADGS